MTDQDVRDFLERMAVEEPAPFLDPAPLTRRARRRAARTVVFGALGAAAAIAALFVGVSELREASPTVPAIDPTPTPAAVASGAIAYSLDGDIYVADPEGSNAVRIADSTTDARCEGISEYSMPSWSPDGTHLAFQRDCPTSDQTDVVITDPQGNIVTEVPRDGWGFSWSPDSTRIAVWETWPETVDVYGVDGEREESLALGPDVKVHNDASPMWMPDGSALLMDGVYEIPLDGGSPHEWGVGLLRRLEQVTYSADGTRVALIKRNSIDILDVADGTSVSTVAGLTDVDVWSPDGDRFASLAHGELNVVDVASGTVTVLTEARTALNGAKILGVRGFSPRGDRILYEAGDGVGGATALWSIGVHGSGARIVVAGTTQGDWRSR